MRLPAIRARTLAFIAVLALLVVAFVWVVMRSGPLARVPVTTTTAERIAVAPAMSGIGIVESLRTYRIGPTQAGRLKSVLVDVGERVRAGQLLGEMDPVDLDHRVEASRAALERARAGVSAAQAQEADVAARRRHAETEARRYEQLLLARSVSEEALEARRHELRLADAGLLAAHANLDGARRELDRARADLDGMVRQRANLRLVAPVDGLVTARSADPGTSLVAGQPVVEVIDPATLWVNARFDQSRAGGLRAGLPARVTLRSRGDQAFAARVARIEPKADDVTEELLAKVVLEPLPRPLPSIGELAEVTVELPALDARPTVPNASVQRSDGTLGVWLVEAGALRFAPVRVGASDLDGRTQIVDGLRGGESVVVYSQKLLGARSRITVVDRIPGVAP